jgi:DNA repair protein RecO (recombination protein O)
MDESADGIILRTRPLTESSLIVHWLTAEQGRVATVAKGARRPKSAFNGKLDLFFEAELTFKRSRRSELHTLREISLRSLHPDLRKSLPKIEQLTYFIQLIEQTTETDTPIPDTHHLFSSALCHLENNPTQPRLVFAFELRHLNDLGLAPNLEESRLSTAARELVVTLLTAEWTEIPKLQTTAGVAREIQQFLHGYLIFHLDRLPKGRNAALKT